MTVCFFSQYSDTNNAGASHSMFNIADELVKRGHRVIIVLSNLNNMDERMKDKRIKYIISPFKSMRITVSAADVMTKPKFFLKKIYNSFCAEKLYNILRKENIDIIHINGLDTPIGAVIAERLNIPYVWHIRQFLFDDFGQVLFDEKKTYGYVRNADSVIAISNDVRNKFLPDFGEKIEVIYNGIPREKYEIKNHRILNNDRVNLIIAGRIYEQKGQLDAVKAVCKLVKNGYNVCLFIIGSCEDEDYLDSIKKITDENNINDNIKILEHCDDLKNIRSECDIGLTCSFREAFGRITVENMMAGLFVIGSDTGGTPEIIDDGENGLLYSVNDYIDLADKIQWVIDNREKAKIIAGEGYKKSLKSYSVTGVVDLLSDIYNKVTEK